VALKDDYLIDTLADMGLVTNSQIEEIRAEAEAAGQGVVDTMLAKKLVAPADVTQARAVQFGAAVVDLAGRKFDKETLDAIPRHVAKRYRVMPLEVSDSGIIVAITDPSDLDTIDSLQHLLKRGSFEYRVASDEQIDAALNRYYGSAEETVDKMLQDITSGTMNMEEYQQQNAMGSDADIDGDSDAPLIKLVNAIITDAFKLRASDIHIEPLEQRVRVRYRVDGVLQEVNGPPKRLQAAIISRIKIQSGMSIAEKRIPQDGRIQLNINNKQVDFRVNCLPTGHGESMVLRILDKSGIKLGLAQLGFLTDDQQTFERLVGMSDGILLVTGPTGSGKTTTLYSCLNYINRPDRKIITVEDPVEYQLAGINQVQVSEAAGLSFAVALRAMLRQAPNVVMLGEIRDLETAGIAINASLTGHLVFSTLHTNDAPSAVQRLIDIGIKPFLVASACRGLMAQRLVRKICKGCAAPHMPTEEQFKALELDPANITGANYSKGAGCSDCNKKGFRGRAGIFEIFVVDDGARKLVFDKASAVEIRNYARKNGMRTLREDGARKVVSGFTTAEEVISATTSDH
jgi:general secretion pathway protein E/type IV pilus assembly protein PilB